MTRRIGGHIAQPLGSDLLGWVTTYAAQHGVTRAHAVRAIVLQFAVDHARAHGATIDGPDPIIEWRPIGAVTTGGRRTRAVHVPAELG